MLIYLVEESHQSRFATFSADLPTNNADDAFMVCIYVCNIFSQFTYYVCRYTNSYVLMFRFLNRFINYRGTILFAGL